MSAFWGPTLYFSVIGTRLTGLFFSGQTLKLNPIAYPFSTEKTNKQKKQLKADKSQESHHLPISIGLLNCHCLEGFSSKNQKQYLYAYKYLRILFNQICVVKSKTAKYFIPNYSRIIWY